MVDQHVLLFRGDEAFRVRGVDGEDALVKAAHVLHERHHDVQTGRVDGFLDFAKLHDQRVLALIHREKRRRSHHNGHQNNENERVQTIHGQRPPDWDS